MKRHNVPRGGRTPDYSQKKREFIFNLYHKEKGERKNYEIAEAIGVSAQMLSGFKRTLWWQEMESERQKTLETNLLFDKQETSNV